MKMRPFSCSVRMITKTKPIARRSREDRRENPPSDFGEVAVDQYFCGPEGTYRHAEGTEMPADFDPEKHHYMDKSSYRDFQYKVFIAVGRSLDIVDHIYSASLI